MNAVLHNTFQAQLDIGAEPARVLCVDPPWSFGDKLPGDTRGAAKNYKTLELADIMRFPLPRLAEPCILFLWRVAAMPQEALDVIKAWGFTIKSEIVWVKKLESGKTAFGMGHYVRGAHEVCLIATRGGRFHVKDKAVRSIFETHVLEAPLGKHSEKPDAFYELVENLAGDGPMVELFARKPRPGWHCFGAELPGGHVYTPKGEPAAATSSIATSSPPTAEEDEVQLVDLAANKANFARSPETPRINGIRTIGDLVDALAKRGARVSMTEMATWPVSERDAADDWLQHGGLPPEAVERAMKKTCAACADKKPVGVGAPHTGEGPFCVGDGMRGTAEGEPLEGPDPAPGHEPEKRKRGRPRKDAAPATLSERLHEVIAPAAWTAAQLRSHEASEPEHAFFEGA